MREGAIRLADATPTTADNVTETKNAFIGSSPFMTVAELARYIGINYNHAYAMIKFEGFPYYTFGNTYRVRIDEVMEWLKNHRDLTFSRSNRGN